MTCARPIAETVDCPPPGRTRRPRERYARRAGRQGLSLDAEGRAQWRRTPAPTRSGSPATSSTSETFGDDVGRHGLEEVFTGRSDEDAVSVALLSAQHV